MNRPSIARGDRRRTRVAIGDEIEPSSGIYCGI